MSSNPVGLLFVHVGQKLRQQWDVCIGHIQFKQLRYPEHVTWNTNHLQYILSYVSYVSYVCP